MFADQTQAELETLIANIDASIARTLNAESYQVGTRQLKRPSLSELLKIRRSAVKQLQAILGEDHGVVSFDPAPDPDPNFS